MKIMALLTILASLFGCTPEEPQILDGPGMVYVDSEYRSVYANCLPFEDARGVPYLAIAYLGKGTDGAANKDVYIEKIFESLTNEEKAAIRTYEYEGDDWYLVIPKYRDSVSLKKGEDFLEESSYQGEAFVLRCNSDITINCFNVTELNYMPDVDEKGNLKGTDENVWNITDIDKILKTVN